MLIWQDMICTMNLLGGTDMKTVMYQIPIHAENEKSCLHQMIQQIQKRPGMYIGSNALTPLSLFLAGYRAAERDFGICWYGGIFPLDFQFMHSFVDVRLQTKHVCAGWCRNILTFCHGDEEKALNLFFNLYQEFIHIEMKRYWKAVLTKENIEQNDKMERTCSVKEQGQEPIFKNPISVYILELTISAYVLIVETTNEVIAESCFFTSAEEAKGNSLIPMGAEAYFGKINIWEEFEANSLYFNKVIRTH